MTKPNKVELVLVKTDKGITASNEAEGTIDYFDETEEARQQFVLFMVDNFINKEIAKGTKYN